MINNYNMDWISGLKLFDKCSKPNLFCDDNEKFAETLIMLDWKTRIKLLFGGGVVISMKLKFKSDPGEFTGSTFVTMLTYEDINKTKKAINILKNQPGVTVSEEYV